MNVDLRLRRFRLEISEKRSAFHKKTPNFFGQFLYCCYFIQKIRNIILQCAINFTNLILSLFVVFSPKSLKQEFCQNNFTQFSAFMMLYLHAKNQKSMHHLVKQYKKLISGLFFPKNLTRLFPKSG